MTPGELEDRAAIKEVMVRYAHGLDQRDYAMLAACFTPDAYADYGSFKDSGVEKIIDFLRSVLPRFEKTMHFLGNQLITFREREAEVETYVVAYHVIPSESGRKLLVVGARYLDRMVPVDGRWVVQHRVEAFDWRQTSAL
ncbi:MAG: nuclear transport factor 2 family protein [Chloroflexi bacterium]|nr:nuclear transport factor 2 family protein [Chloroflexota bacterium]